MKATGTESLFPRIRQVDKAHLRDRDILCAHLAVPHFGVWPRLKPLMRCHRRIPV
jgi:hypothetical protein